MFQLVLFEPLSSESDILKDKEPEMAVCTSCGSEVDESAGFCTSCGQRMPVSSAAINVTRPICSACSAQVEPGSVFCTNCGQRMATQPAVVEEAARVRLTVKPHADRGSAVGSRYGNCPASARNCTRSCRFSACPAGGTTDRPSDLCRAQRVSAPAARRKRVPHNRSDPAVVDSDRGFWRLVFYGRGNSDCLQPAGRDGLSRQ